MTLDGSLHQGCKTKHILRVNLYFAGGQKHFDSADLSTLGGMMQRGVQLHVRLVDINARRVEQQFQKLGDVRRANIRNRCLKSNKTMPM